MMFEMIKNKIRAIFSINGNGVVIDLHSAEIKKGQAYLHPEDNEKITYVVKVSTTDILLNDGVDIPEEDVRIIEGTKSTTSVDEIYEDILSVEEKKNQTTWMIHKKVIYFIRNYDIYVEALLCQKVIFI